MYSLSLQYLTYGKENSAIGFEKIDEAFNVLGCNESEIFNIYSFSHIERVIVESFPP